jgi:hypothetical protein
MKLKREAQECFLCRAGVLGVNGWLDDCRTGEYHMTLMCDACILIVTEDGDLVVYDYPPEGWNWRTDPRPMYVVRDPDEKRHFARLSRKRADQAKPSDRWLWWKQYGDFRGRG